MTLDEQQEFILKVDQKIKTGADVIYTNFSNVEDSMYDLFKVAPAVFDEEMMKSAILDFVALDKIMGNFETIYAQKSDPVTISQAILLDQVMKKLDKLFDRCVQYITECNKLVDNYEFDLNKVVFIEKIENKFSYEIIHWLDLDEVINSNNPFIVAKTSDVLDEDYDESMYPLHTLRLTSFPDKTSAYRYMLANGIKKENLILRY